MGAQGGHGLEAAREICLRRLTLRPHTRAELERLLRRRGVEESVAREILDCFGEVGLIDDDTFARAWVTSRHHGRGLARKALARELRNKGVADETVGRALAELDDETEEATARAIVSRKLRTARRDRPEATFRRLVGVLARRGYSPALAVRVVRDALAEASEVCDVVDEIDVDALTGVLEGSEPGLSCDGL